MTGHDNRLIRNNTSEFLIFTAQAGEPSIEARYKDETVWLTQKLMAELCAVDVRTAFRYPWPHRGRADRAACQQQQDAYGFYLMGEGARGKRE